jgi:hypothetical protein
LRRHDAKASYIRCFASFPYLPYEGQPRGRFSGRCRWDGRMMRGRVNRPPLFSITLSEFAPGTGRGGGRGVFATVAGTGGKALHRGALSVRIPVADGGRPAPRVNWCMEARFWRHGADTELIRRCTGDDTIQPSGSSGKVIHGAQKVLPARCGETGICYRRASSPVTPVSGNADSEPGNKGWRRIAKAPSLSSRNVRSRLHDRCRFSRAPQRNCGSEGAASCPRGPAPDIGRAGPPGPGVPHQRPVTRHWPRWPCTHAATPIGGIEARRGGGHR